MWRSMLVVGGMLMAGMVSADDTKKVTVCKLRNVAATDAGTVAKSFVQASKMDVVIDVDLQTNSLLISGDQTHVSKLMNTLEQLDQEPTRMWVPISMFEVPSSFAKDFGLEEGEKWILTPRETSILLAGMKKDKSTERVSKPELMLTDNQQAFFEFSKDSQANVLAITSRLTADRQSVLMRIETKSSKAHTDGHVDIQLFQNTAMIPLGHTLVVRTSRVSAGKTETKRDLIQFVTVHLVQK